MEIVLKLHLQTLFSLSTENSVRLQEHNLIFLACGHLDLMVGMICADWEELQTFKTDFLYRKWTFVQKEYTKKSLGGAAD